MNKTTMHIGNTTITSQDITIIGVNKIFDIGYNQYIHSVDIQTTNQIINKDTGYINIIYYNHTYLCSPDEYEKYKRILLKE